MSFIKNEDLTTILVTHSMEDAARYADHIAIMHEGRCVLTGTPREIFADVETLAQLSFRTTTYC